MRLAHSKGIYVLLDECYVYLTFTGEIVSGASLTECKEHVIVLGSLSKTYAMTGWRAGFALGPKQIISAMSKLQSQSTSNTASMVQRASIAALTGSQDCVSEMRADYIKLRDRVLEGFKSIPGLTCTVPQGAFYVYPNISAFLGKGGIKSASRSRGEAAERGACGGGAGRGVRDREPHSAVVRGVGRCDRQGRGADARVLREALNGIEREDELFDCGGSR